MSFGAIVYASLAQLSVRGQANQQIESRSVGTLDIFSSAMWTHPTFAGTMVRMTDETTEIYYSEAGNRMQNATFMPPRSIDVLYNMYIVIDIPGLVEEAQFTVRDQDGNTSTSTMEVLNAAGFKGIGFPTKVEGGSITADLQSATPASGDAAASKAEYENLSWWYTRYWMEDSNKDVFITSDGSTFTDKDGNGGTPADGAATIIELMPDYDLTGDITDLKTVARYFCTRQNGDIARYQNAVGQALIDSVEMSVGGTPLAKLPGTWLYVHEELHGQIGRTLYEMVGNDPEANILERQGKSKPEDDSVTFLESQSQMHRRLYVPVPFWWCGGKLDRALKLIGMQLHRMEFKCSMHDLGKVIYRPSGDLFHLSLAKMEGGAVVPIAKSYENLSSRKVSNYAADSSGDINKGTTMAVGATRIMARAGETMQATRQDANMRAVRSGGAVKRMSASTTNVSLNSNIGQAKMTVDFHGLFLNNTKRQEYLNLEDQTLFSQLQTQSETLADSRANKTTQLNFQNAVYEIVITAQNEDEKKLDGWGLGGSNPNNVGQRGEMIETLDFSLAATPRTHPNLEGTFYREVTQFQSAEKTSSKKGIYFYPLYEKKELNNIRLVSGYINCSKVDDLKIRMKPTSDGVKSQVEMFARSYNLLHIKNGMVGKMFQ